MKEYRTVSELKQDWFTTKELFPLLKDNGYPATIESLKRWEKWGIIPNPVRVSLKKQLWRVYKKDGSDFDLILNKLNSRSRKVVIEP